MAHQRLSRYRCSLLDTVQLVAIALVALALVPTLSHLFSLPSSLRLTPSDYLVSQRVDHTALLAGGLGLLALAGVALHTFLVRGHAAAFAWSIVAACGLSAAQIVLWSVAIPIATSTEGWTLTPDNFEEVRWHWEYALAAVGMLSLGALVALVRATEASRPIASLTILESIEKDAAVRAARQRARALDGDKAQIESNIAA